MSADPKKSVLNRFLNLPNGITKAEAASRVDLHLQLLGDKAEAEIKNLVDALGVLLAAPEPPDADARAEIQRIAGEITSLGGTFGREALSKAGYCLCRLLDQLGERWDGSAVAVHYDAMRLLIAARPYATDSHAGLLEGLEKVRARVLAEPAAAQL